MSYDLLQRFVLGDIQIVALVELIIPFVHHLSWHVSFNRAALPGTYASALMSLAGERTLWVRKPSAFGDGLGTAHSPISLADSSIYINHALLRDDSSVEGGCLE